MEEKLIEYSDKIVEALESGIDFAGEQAPLLIQEVLAYYGVMSGIWSIFFFILTVSIFYYGIKIIKIEYKNNDVDNVFLGCIFLIVIGFIPVGLFIEQISTFIQIQIAPRLFLIEKLGELL